MECCAAGNAGPRNCSESQISYPVLSFFRSQHSNQSWLGALTTMLDVTSLVLTGIEGVHPGQAKLTFAMARHAGRSDLAQVVNARYDPQAPERLAGDDFNSLRDALMAAGVEIANQRRGSAKTGPECGGCTNLAPLQRDRS